MKFLLPLFCLCFSASAQLALNNAFYNQFVSRRASVTNMYFFQEYFEAPGYENTWTTNGTGGVINPDNSAAPLQGTYSFSINLSADSSGVRSAFTAQPTLYGFFLIRFSNLPGTGANEDFFALYSSGSKVMSLWLAGGNTLRWTSNIGAEQATTVSTLANNTTYYVWWSYAAGSGANATFSIAFTTTPTRPTSGDDYAQYTTSTLTSAVDMLRIGGDTLPGTDSFACRYDAIIVSTTQVGDNPF